VRVWLVFCASTHDLILVFLIVCRPAIDAYLPHVEMLCRSHSTGANVWDAIVGLLWLTVASIEHGQALLTLREATVTEVLTNALQQVRDRLHLCL
jgi:hypothetical protein